MIELPAIAGLCASIVCYLTLGAILPQMSGIAPRVRGLRATASNRGKSVTKLATTVGISIGVALLPFGYSLSSVIGAAMISSGLTFAWLRYNKSQTTKRRSKQLKQELPVAVEIIRISLGGGRSLTESLEDAGAGVNGQLATEFRLVTSELAVGNGLVAALQRLNERCEGSGVSELVSLLLRNYRYGTDISSSLGDLVKRSREQLAREIIHAAAASGPKIQMVVSLINVPAVMLLIAAAFASS